MESYGTVYWEISEFQIGLDAKLRPPLENLYWLSHSVCVVLKLCGQTNYHGLNMKRCPQTYDLSVCFPSTRPVVGDIRVFGRCGLVGKIRSQGLSLERLPAHPIVMVTACFMVHCHMNKGLSYSSSVMYRATL